MSSKEKNQKQTKSDLSFSHVDMPEKPETERAVLGAVLQKPELLDELVGVLNEESFYSKENQYVWNGLIKLKNQGKSIDLVMVNEQLTKDKCIDICGGPVFLTRLIESTATPSHALEWAKELQAYTQRRLIIQTGCEMIQQASDLGTDPRTIVLDVQDKTQVVLDSHDAGQSCRPADFIWDWVDRLETLADEGGPVVRLPYKEATNIMSGFFPGEQTVLAGRPSTGKTALGVNLVEYSLNKGIGCGIFSLEMPKFALLNRLAASNMLSGSGFEVDAMRFRDGGFSDQDWTNINSFGSAILSVPLRIWDRPRLTPTDFYVQCRLWAKEIGMRFVLLDYLQLMEPDHRGGSREREISEMSRAIKQTVNELGIHILLLCQLNRESEKSKRPLLSHLRESGALEQDADNVLFIVPWKREKDQELIPVEVDIAKGRNNSCGTVPLNYRRRHLQFVSPAEESLLADWEDGISQ